MNILVVASTFPRWKNDTEPRFVYDLSKRLAKKHSVTVLAPHVYGARKNEVVARMRIYRFQYFFPARLQKLCYNGGIIQNMRKSWLAKLQIPFLSFFEVAALTHAFRKSNPQVIHAHWLLPQGIAGALVKKMRGGKLIITIHGSDIHAYKLSVFTWLQRWSLNQADAITVNSSATKKSIVSRFPEVKEKVHTIPMGVDLHLFSQSTPTKKFPSKKVILFVGRLSEQKGAQYLLQAMPEINKHIKNAHLVIIGGGQYEETLKQLQHKLKVDNVTFTGPLQHDKLPQYYKRADLYIQPSITGPGLGIEGFGLAVAEAMAASKPIIATATGGLKDLIQNNKNGVAVPERNSKALAAATILLLTQSKIATKYAKAAGEKAKGLSWEVTTKKFMSLIDEL